MKTKSAALYIFVKSVIVPKSLAWAAIIKENNRGFFVCSQSVKHLRSVSARKMESLVNNKEMLVLSIYAF